MYKVTPLDYNTDPIFGCEYFLESVASGHKLIGNTPKADNEPVEITEWEYIDNTLLSGEWVKASGAAVSILTENGTNIGGGLKAFGIDTDACRIMSKFTRVFVYHSYIKITIPGISDLILFRPGLQGKVKI